MRAVVLHEHGDLDRLVYEPAYRDPVCGPGDALVRVRACALNYHDVFTRRGMPGIKLGLPLIVGNDAAGEIAAVGADVRDFKIGDRVVVDPIDRVDPGFLGETLDGGLAEFVRVPSHMLIPLDPAVDFVAAAALPVAYGTAHRMMVDRGRIKAGETVLILGASGGVGTCCIQLAKQAGATVAVCASSDEKLTRLKSVGADYGINYATGDWVAECHKLFGRASTRRRTTGGLDMVVNFTGGDAWTKGLRVLRRDGRMVTCGATAGYDPKEDIRYIWTFELNIIGSNGWSREDVTRLLAMVKAGTLRPVLHDRRYGLAEAREAMRQIEERLAVGKVIVEPAA
ncbi:MAG: zinc-binding dehydrogenase [Proteobacteria bacterium]|nr:zinc-binding dehydrogenase [Pseudomonadota bacterium]